MRTLRVLICGAGVAGNALAFWLSRQGHVVTIVERALSLRTTGLQIDLRGHGVTVLRRMGLEKAFRSLSVDEEGPAVRRSLRQSQSILPSKQERPRTSKLHQRV